MAGGNTSAGRRIFNAVLIILDVALLVWIVLSWHAQKKTEITPETGNPGFGSIGVVSVSDGNGSDGGVTGGTETLSLDPGSISDVDNQEGGQNVGPDVGSQDGGQAVGPDVGNQDGGQNGEPPEGMDYNQNGELVNLTDGGPDYSTYNAVQRPEPGDFDDWKNLASNIPARALTNTDFGEITGRWKGFFEYDMAEELVTFVISGDASSAVLNVDWYLIHFFGDGSWMNEEDMEDLPFYGTWSDGVLTAASDGGLSVMIRTIYEWSGQQYAFGEMTLTDGSTAVVGMVRP